MKKRLLLLTPIIITSLCAMSQVSFRDADLVKLNYLMHNKSGDEGPRFARDIKRGADNRVDVIVRYDGREAITEIEANGGEIVSLVGTRTAIVRVAPEDAVAVAASRGVTGARLSAKLKRVNDKSMSFSNVTAVREGTGLPRSFDGSDVVIGLFDVGVDPNHINFKDAQGNSRVKVVYEYPEPTARPDVYDTPASISSYTSDTRSESHGTHVLGIMGGSFVDRTTAGAPDYRGVAPGADIVVASGEGYNVQILDAIDRIGRYAQSQGKPCVINLSFGDNMGPHDGSDEFTEAINDVAEKYNAVICLAGGNEREDKSYIIKELTEDSPALKTLVTKGSSISSATVQASSEVEIWTEDGTPFTVSLDIISKTKPDEVLYSYVIPQKKAGFVTQGDLINDVTDTRRIDMITEGTKFHELYSNSFMGGIAGVDIYNKRYNAQLMLHLEARNSGNANRYFVRINVTGQPGKKIFMYANEPYMNFSSRYIPGLDEPDGAGSNSNMASGPNTIAVGSYVTHNITGSGYKEGTIGDISYFSSFGETLDGRVMPDVCAPGQVIVSSRNSYMSSSYEQYYPATYSYRDNSTRKDYVWTICAGTSQASPHMAGIAALWLQANPELGYTDIQRIARESAVAQTEGKGWGHGKVDALAGLKMILSEASVNDVISDIADKIMIEPAGNGTYEVFVPGNHKVTASVYSMQGIAVLTASAPDGNLTVDTSSLPAGVYVMQVSSESATRSMKFTVR
ncbi:MAG: S8 family serine peptidase [Muribaculaceae bacterium]|nr:S8 family serine peptidase [Muribaculaceae bacterium]